MNKNPATPGVITLYKNHKNKIGFWQGWVEHDTVIIEYATGIHDSPQRISETVHGGKQGRSVNEQAEFRLRSRANSKIDAGYVTSMDAALVPPTDANGNLKPMLAQKFKDYRKKIDPTQAFIQYKYNGHRCLITNQNGEYIAFSRNGKEMPGISHILAGMNLPEGMTIDGEVYKHGMRLQQIASLCKKKQEDSCFLSFIAYDLILPDEYSDRLTQLKELTLGDAVKVAPTKRLDTIPDLNETFERVRNAGYEGLMMRLDGVPYEAGRRSPSLLKIKHTNDAEFPVVDITASKDGWGILHCLLPNASTFKVSAPGTLFEKERILLNKEKYIGKLATVEYSEFTRDGVPFHPVCIGFKADL